MHIFPLNAKTHADFLKQERKDPITGDAFKAGDEVVFCAACRSAFLRESWQFMEGKHCNQEETLESFPKAQKALTLQKLRNKRWYPKYFANSILYEKDRVIGILFATFGMPTLLGFLALLDIPDSEAIARALLCYFRVGIILFTIPYSISILVFLDKVTTKKYFSISTKKLFFSFNQYFKAKDIQHLQFTLLKRVAKKDILQFTIQLKNKEELYIEREIHGEDVEVNAVLEGLAIFSKYAPVTVSIQHQREYDFLLEKKAQYQAPIEIEILE